MATSTAILGSVLLIALASIYNKDRFQSGKMWWIMVHYIKNDFVIKSL